MAGPLGTIIDRPFGVCFGHKYPIPWVGTCIPMQGTVLANGSPALMDMNLVICSCGHTAYVFSNLGITHVVGRRAIGGPSFVGGGPAIGIDIPMTTNIIAS